MGEDSKSKHNQSNDMMNIDNGTAQHSIAIYINAEQSGAVEWNRIEMNENIITAGWMDS